MARARVAALFGAAVWGLFFVVVLLVHAWGLITFAELRPVSVLFVVAVAINLLLAAVTWMWIDWPGAAYGYEAVNAILATAVFAHTGGSTEYGIVFVIYGFLVVHTWMIHPDASPFVTALICGAVYVALVVAESQGWIEVTPLLHRPPRAGERWALAVFGILALNALALYASRYAAERRRFSDRLSELVRERTQALAEANAQLISKAHALEHERRQIENFVYSVTHDLKTPVNNVVLLSDALLEADAVAPPAARKRIERIRHIAMDAENMILDLFRFMQITTEPEAPTWCDPQPLVRKVLQSLEGEIDGKRLRVDCGTLARVWARPTKLSHVLANLLGNAVKYAPQEGGCIAVHAAATGDRWCLEVRDNGPGIPPEFHARIFDLFGRVTAGEPRRNGARSGTGVGLAIVKRIAEEHGGTVAVDSEPGMGSVFRVHLPLPAAANRPSERSTPR